MKYLAVAAGGALGAAARYFLGGTILSRVAPPFPLATFVINVTGSFVLGFFLTAVSERAQFGPHLRLAVAVGFVGAYTTFSTFEYETLRLVEERGFVPALLNVLLSVAVGFAAVWGGVALARRWRGAPASSAAGYERFEELADLTDPPQLPGSPRDIRDSTIEPTRRSDYRRH
ncbi:MAG TPA: fluoride efflux transporter CrcB [Pyrinomonadaceae bacterium]|nr:fluoride efflux transporter CrcB [Pyrinomonadaceae bacterium]